MFSSLMLRRVATTVLAVTRQGCITRPGRVIRFPPDRPYKRRPAPSRWLCTRPAMPSRSVPSAHPANFRARILRDLFAALAVPSAVLYALLSFNGIHLGLFAPPVYFLFFLGWATSKGAYWTRRQRKLAEQLGARPVPCVVGRWPGNLDILLKMMGAFKTSYILDVYLQLFEEYQCTTLNLRILWGDNVSVSKRQYL